MYWTLKSVFLDYELTRLDGDRHGGGVIIYVAGHLPFTVISSGPHSLQFSAISVSSPFGQFVVSVLYRLHLHPLYLSLISYHQF